MKHLTYAFPILLCILFMFQSETFAATSSCEDVFRDQQLFQSAKSGGQILHEKNPQLHTSSAVERFSTKYKRTTGIALRKPVDKLNQWLNYLDQLSAKAESSPKTEEKIKTILYNQYVIKPNEVPESYYNLQIRIAKDRGHGDIRLTSEQKQQLTDIVIVDQKKSLDSWSDYLISKDSSMYPMWLKYWMFTGMAKLSKYDAQVGQFGNRDKTTVTPFIEINREALGLVVDHVLKFINKKSLEEISDPELEKLLSGLNFGKLYSHFLFKLGVGKEGKFKTNDGRWVIYPKGSDHIPLVKSLAGQNTGWCTAGESSAKSQLSRGDFHVYYSLDEHNQPTIPRVAIRMEGNEISEVRGVAASQNLDSQINQSNIVSSKMKTFGAKADAYLKKDLDMKLLTHIEAKHKLNQVLTSDEIKFLYEVNNKINGFGYQKDPRIEKIKSERDFKNDLVVLYEYKYKRDEISTTREDVLSGKIKIHHGDLDLSDLTSAAGLELPETFNGFLHLGGLTSAVGLKLPETLNGFLHLGGLTSAVGLKLPETFNGSLHLGGLTSAVGLKLPNTINGYLGLGGLTSAVGLKLPDIINGSLHLGGLTSSVGLKLPETFNGYLDLGSLASAVGLKLPDSINGYLNLNSLTSAEGLKLPDIINGFLDLNSLTSAVGLKLPDIINGSLYLNRLKSAVGLKLPDTINGSLNLRGLSTAAGIKKPRGVTMYYGPEDIQD